MPEFGIGGQQGPGKTFNIHAGLNESVLRDIDVIINVNETELINLPENGGS